MRYIPILFLTACTALSPAAHALPRNAAQRVQAAPVATNEFRELSGEERLRETARIEDYLSKISSIVANFSQKSTDGSAGTGKFFMKRPGKMRWQYDKPTPILLISDGKSVTYYDASLDQVTYIGIDDTLAGFLIKKDIKLDSDSTKLVSLTANKDVIRAKIIQAAKPSEGSLTVEFTSQPLEIKYLTSVDTTGNETRVELQNTQFGPVLDDKIFVFNDPRAVNRRRNKK